MREIEAIREDINTLDYKLQELFIKRMNLSKEVAQYKKNQNKPIRDPLREEAIIKSILEKQEYPEETAELYRCIMDVSSVFQEKEIFGSVADEFPTAPPYWKFLTGKTNTVVCTGAENEAISTLSQTKSIRTIYRDSYKGVLDSLLQNEADYAFLPEKKEIYNLLYYYKTYISHSFLLSKTVESKSFLPIEVIKENLPTNYTDKVFKNTQDNPASQENIIDIANKTAYYSLSIQDNIIDWSNYMANGISEINPAVWQKENPIVSNFSETLPSVQIEYIRYMLVSKSLPIYSDADKTSIILTVPDTPGGLESTLRKFSLRKINLSKIQSFTPFEKHEGYIFFYIEFFGSVSSIREALKELTLCTDPGCSYACLGSYKESLL